MAMNAAALAAFDRAVAIVENPGRYTHAERATAARELRDLKTAMEADTTAMQQQIEAGADAVKGIVDNWSSGDLAQAVNTAESWRDDVMTVFPDFDWTDQEAEESEGAESESESDDLEPTYAGELEVGDAVDLEGCDYATDEGFPAREFELYTIIGVERETPGCVRIDFDGAPSLGLPPGYSLPTKRHAES